MKRDKTAWVTSVVDETTALEAIVLAKSLSRVITAADTIVLTPHDISVPIRNALTHYFDVVILENVSHQKSKVLPKEDLLLLGAWNLGMYSKCVILNSNSMILKNSDELFKIEKDAALVFVNCQQNNLEASVFAIKPCLETYIYLSKLTSNGHTFKNLTEFLTKLKSSSVYNFDISQKYHQQQSLQEMKIISFGKYGEPSRREQRNENDGKLKGVFCLWDSLYNDIRCDIRSELTFSRKISGPNDLTEMYSVKKSYLKDAIAVCGYSCRFPGANNSNEFWDLIKNGGDGICQVPSDRLFEFQRHDPRYAQSKAGFLKCAVDEFDAKFFGISPREATFMDPQQRLLVEVAWEALEDAAINPHSLKGSNTGVFTGVWTHDYERLITENPSGKDFHHVVLGNVFSATSSRVSYFLGLNGPNLATESGCSSSLVALHLACESLRAGETNLGLVLGANIIILQFPLAEIPILASDGHCKTFDEKADGFGRAEGVAVLVLKRLTDAVNDGDRIMGIIRGSALSNEGTTSSFGTPSKVCQEIAVRNALKNAGVKPSEIDYVESHGTGTPVGDPVEFAALSQAYKGKRDKPLIVGSVKTNIGHTESAAGLAGVIKVLLSMKHEMIPPHKNFQTLNPNINLSSSLDNVSTVIPLEAMPWRRNSNRVRIAGVSSFGISGTNVHTILEEVPGELNDLHLQNNFNSERERTHHILTLSAKSENALNRLSSKYADFLKENPTVNIGDVTFTANNGRAHLKHKVSVVAKDIQELKSKLNQVNYVPGKIQPGKSKIGFLFTGQGSQYFGMGKDLYDSSPVFRNSFQDCARILEKNLGISLTNVIWGNGNNSLLEQSIHSQLTIFAVEYSLLKLWGSLGIEPEFVLGHSVGEFVAATAAGILNLQDALLLLAERSKLIESLPRGGMLAIRSSEERVTKLISDYLKNNSDTWLDISIINSHEEIVVSGNKSSIEECQKFCTINGEKSHLLAAAHPFHSRAIDEIISRFGKVCEKVKYKPLRCRYISGTTGMELLSGEMNATYWLKHARETVQFSTGIKTLFEEGCNTFIEIGPHPVLLALGLSNLGNSWDFLWLPSLRRNEDNWKTLLTSVGTLFTNHVEIKWKSLDMWTPRKKLQLPFYPFERQKYWVNFEGKEFSKTIHPLLGRRVSLAKTKDVVYENTWNLKDLAYLCDHQVAHTIVLPGAGFLEIILAAGRDCFQNFLESSENVLKVEDFVVESPMQLEEEKNYKIQIIASQSENNPNKLFIRIYMYQKLNGYNEEKGWKQYSSAWVLLEKESSDDFNKDKLETIKDRCPTEKSGQEFYKLAPEVGIFFGETFQSVETVWEGTNEVVAKIPLRYSVVDMQDYIYHPIILDAMIQSFGLSIGKENADLYLPVGVGAFRMLQTTFDEYCFAHAKWESGSTSGTVSLYSKDNSLLAVMENIRLLRTSVSSFLNVINAQKNMLPGLYTEKWRSRDGPVQSRMDLEHILDFDLVHQDLIRVMEEPMKNLDPKVLGQLGNEIIALGIMETFLKNDFTPEISKVYNHRTFMEQNLLSSSHNWFVFRLFEILSEDGYFAPIDNEYGIPTEWRATKEFPTLVEIAARENDLQQDIESRTPGGKHVFTEIVLKCKDKLWNILQGKENSVAVLFGHDGVGSSDIYNNGTEEVASNIRVGHFFQMVLQELKPGGKMANSIVRIIEIGGGSAATSREIIRTLQNEGIAFRYTFTDISPHFLENAKKEFTNISGVDYGILDIEKDPSSQGYCPHHYDIVIAANVLHATENLRTSVKNIRELLMPGGVFVMKEQLKKFRQVDFIFGILEDFARFKDFDLRKTHPVVSKQIWDQVFLENGFTSLIEMSEQKELSALLITRATETVQDLPVKDIVTGKEKIWLSFSDFGEKYSPLYQKFSLRGEKVLEIKSSSHPENSEDAIYINEEDFEQFKNAFDVLYKNYVVSGVIFFCTVPRNANSHKQIHLQLLNLCKYFANNTKFQDRIYVVTRGTYYISNNETTVHPENASLLGMAKSLLNEMPLLRGKIIDLDPEVVDVITESDEIFFELFREDETIVSYRNRKRLVNRFVRMPKPEAPLILPQGRYKIDIPNSKKIKDVKFRPADREQLGDDDVEILVKAFALNFRDVFVILKPESYSTLFDAVGTDFAGIVSQVGNSVSKFKIGDKVFGISQASSAASHVIVNSNMLLRKPKEFTFADASTIPSVFLTAYHCLVTIGNLQKGERILIHVASGGVGLIAIQIAKYIGAEIIATAGSHRKRNYLKSLGIKHVFHSRDLTFGAEIQNLGIGIDVVLNSLTGHGFKETTLGVCNKGARFIEIGKVNIWQPEDVRNLRPDIFYTIVDLEKVDRHGMTDLMIAMENLFDTKVCSPLPYSRFEIECIRDALNYFLKAQHIGKIIVATPEIKNKGGYNFSNDLIFNSNATYLITGGLGGIGLEVAKWMADSGAKNIVLVGRTAPTDGALQVLNKINGQGCRVWPLQVDVGNWHQCKTLFDKIESNRQLPPLRGVIHSAGTLSDGVFKNQTWEKFQTVFNAKVDGGWNLHNLTKDLPLEHFVLFSSIAAIFGPVGQPNHAGANMFLDSLAHYRHSIGLPAQTIQWGAWSDIGAATNSVFGKEGAFGVKPFTPSQGIASLKFVMTRPNLVQSAVIQFDVMEYAQQVPIKGNVLSELLSESENSTSQSVSTQSSNFWEEINGLSLNQRFLNIKSRLENIIRKTLKLPECEFLDEFQTFSEMGLDSLMAVEMRNKLQTIVGSKINLNANALLDHPNINSLSKYLADCTMSETSTEDPSVGKSKTNEVAMIQDLIRKDSILPVDILKLGNVRPVKPSGMKKILLTGATGRFGAYILRDLLQRGTISQIFCLIKSKNAQLAKKKLIMNLKKFHLQNDVDLSHVQIVVGDITKNQLGMSTEEYENLSETVDSVFHLAAKANHVEQYKITKSNSDIRSVNTLGTLNILRFAANKTTKRVIFTSTFATVNRFSEDGYALEEFPEPDNFGDGISMGYVASKFICEKLLREGNRLGVPCTVIRYPTLIGDSQTGVFSIDRDSFLNILLIANRLGVVPDFPGGWYCLPVDVASQLTLEICFNDDTHQKLFNLFQPTPFRSTDMVTLSKRYGNSAQLVSEKEFAEKLKLESKNNSWLSLFTIESDTDFMTMVYGSSLITELSLKNTRSVYTISDNLKTIIPDIHHRIPNISDIVPVYFDFAHRSGLNETLGIR